MSGSEDAADAPALDRMFVRWLVAAGVAVATIAAVLTIGGTEANRGFANITQIVAPLLATVGAWRAASHAPNGAWRRGWLWISASTLSWCVGQSIWTYYESVRGTIVPFPSLADVGFLASVPFAVVGLLSFPSSPSRLTARTLTVLDALMVGGSLLFISWVLVLGPTFDSSAETPLERVISLAYPVADVVLVTIVLITLGRSRGSGRVPLSFVAAGFLVFAFSDSSFVYTTVHDLSPTALANTGWAAGYLLIALGARYAATHPTTVAGEQPLHQSRLALLLPYIPLSAVLVVAAGQRALADAEMDAFEFWLGIVLIGLLLARQAVVLLDNARLTASLAESMARLEHQSLHDTLTGLPNRTLFQDRLGLALARMNRSPELVALMFIDLDGFKPVNDRLGHKAGDVVMVTVGDRINRSVRAGDTVARFGGDEFIVLCEMLPDIDEASVIARRISDSVSLPIELGDETVSVTCSIGLVLADSAEDPPEELIRLADLAMYEAKSRGRANVCVTDRRLTGLSAVHLGSHRGIVGSESPPGPSHAPRGA